MAFFRLFVRSPPVRMLASGSLHAHRVCVCANQGNQAPSSICDASHVVRVPSRAWPALVLLRAPEAKRTAADRIEEEGGRSRHLQSGKGAHQRQQHHSSFSNSHTRELLHLLSPPPPLPLPLPPCLSSLASMAPIRELANIAMLAAIQSNLQPSVLAWTRPFSFVGSLTRPLAHWLFADELVRV